MALQTTTSISIFPRFALTNSTSKIGNSLITIIVSIVRVAKLVSTNLLLVCKPPAASLARIWNQHQLILQHFCLKQSHPPVQSSKNSRIKNSNNRAMTTKLIPTQILKKIIKRMITTRMTINKKATKTKSSLNQLSQRSKLIKQVHHRKLHLNLTQVNYH